MSTGEAFIVITFVIVVAYSVYRSVRNYKANKRFIADTYIAAHLIAYNAIKMSSDAYLSLQRTATSNRMDAATHADKLQESHAIKQLALAKKVANELEVFINQQIANDLEKRHEYTPQDWLTVVRHHGEWHHILYEISINKIYYDSIPQSKTDNEE